jgi:membrane-bound lytic murein transglycosylase A
VATFREVAFADVPGWRDDNLAEAWLAFGASCKALLARPASRDAWRGVCAAASAVDASRTVAVRAFFETQFSPYQIESREGTRVQTDGLITGYYEPLLRGSRVPDARYRYPLYAPPDDLLTVELSALYPELEDKRVRARVEGRRVVPYWTRADIESGRAPVSGKELVYVDDPVEAFFLQIQGSGRIALPDASVVRLGYADQNGQPYRSIGRVLVERGELSLDQASMQGIKQWASDHPEALPALLDENPSYVFFREAPADPDAPIDGPRGALGVPLSPGRSIAVDPRFIPLGAPVFVATTWPLSSRPLSRLMLAQDTGGAIRGPLRADWFWGFGDDAAREAGRMKQEGRLWLLWPKGAPPPPMR